MAVEQVARIDALTREVIRGISNASDRKFLRNTPFGEVMPRQLCEREFALKYFGNSIRWALVRHSSALKSKDLKDFRVAKEATTLAIKIGGYIERFFPKSPVRKETLLMRFLLCRIGWDISQLTMPEATRA